MRAGDTLGAIYEHNSSKEDLSFIGRAAFARSFRADDGSITQQAGAGQSNWNVSLRDGGAGQRSFFGNLDAGVQTVCGPSPSIAGTITVLP